RPTAPPERARRAERQRAQQPLPADPALVEDQAPGVMRKATRCCLPTSPAEPNGRPADGATLVCLLRWDQPDLEVAGSCCVDGLVYGLKAVLHEVKVVLDVHLGEVDDPLALVVGPDAIERSEEHTSELQSR